MARIVEHLPVEELEARYRAARDATEARHFQAIWLLARGRTFLEAAEVLAFAPRWVEEPAARQSLQLSQLAPQTTAALDDDVAGTGGRDGHYIVTWTDPVAIGATGFGLLLELERQGFDVGVLEPYGTGAVKHRVMDLDEATGQVDLVVGEAGIAAAARQPGAVVVAESDIRTEADIERYERLRDEVVGQLQDVGAGELEPTLDAALMAVAIDPRVPEATRELIADMADIGAPAAVFVTPR